jgi:hypothetical protein
MVVAAGVRVSRQPFQQAGDGFYRHLREWFTAFLPRQRGAAQNTITSCRQTWNMLLGYVAEHLNHADVEKAIWRAFPYRLDHGIVVRGLAAARD